MTTTVAELWLPIPDYESLYQVSDCSRARSLDRQTTFLHQGKPRTRHRKGKILAECAGSHGYINITLAKDGVNRCFSLQVLVARAFLGPCPPGHEVAHLDGNRLNNRLDNLKYKTHKENAQDMIDHGRSGKGEKNSNAKLSDQERNQIVDLYRGGMTISELAHAYAVTYQAIWRLLHQ